MMVPLAKLNNGGLIPLLGLGTWKAAPGVVKEAVTTAIQAGYRHIDCAHVYGNEREIGDALTECITSGVCTRSDLFITSKLWNDSHARDEVRPALQHTLQQLQLDYLDMYLVHWPVASKKKQTSDEPTQFYSLEERPIAETWKGMEECATAGLTKGIGVSNFSVQKLQDLLAHCRIVPAVNQVERHPFFQQLGLLEFCTTKNIHLTCYSPLGSMDRPESLRNANEPVVLQCPVVLEVAKRLSITPAQVILKWAMQQGSSTIPKSVNPARLVENLAAAATSVLPNLDEADMAAIAALSQTHQTRLLDGSFWTTPAGSPYTLDNLWDGE